MRFIHTADVRIDIPLVGLRAYNNAPAEQLRNATRDAYPPSSIGLAIDEKVDFMVIAGDLYDGTWPDFSAGLYFCGQMGRLKQTLEAVLLHLRHSFFFAASKLIRASTRHMHSASNQYAHPPSVAHPALPSMQVANNLAAQQRRNGAASTLILS